jgi:predicted AAA+ superfamily ATPase
VVKRVVKHPKGYLRDSGLLHALLRIPDRDALLSHPQMGTSWEGMVVEEILRQLISNPALLEPSMDAIGICEALRPVQAYENLAAVLTPS